MRPTEHLHEHVIRQGLPLEAPPIRARFCDAPGFQEYSVVLPVLAVLVEGDDGLSSDELRALSRGLGNNPDGHVSGGASSLRL